MILRGIRPGRPVDEADLSDLTTCKRTGPAYWHPDEVDALVVPLDPEPTESEALAIRRRLVSADAADEAHLYELLAAVKDNLTPAWARLTLQAELARYGE